MRPYKTSINSKWTNILKNAIETGFGQSHVIIPLLGGSLPISTFYQELGKPVFLMPFAQPDENNHAPNENLMLDWFKSGVKTSIALLTSLGTKNI